MTDDERVTQIFEDGIAAKQVLESPVFRLAFDIVRADILSKFEEESIFNTMRRREKLHMQLKASRAFEKVLSDMITNHKLLHQRIAKQSKLKSVK